jgi:radical SAM protein with 4Fe4S-binding SPASM domain
MEKPHLIAFELTRRCRFDCKHCRAEAGRVNEELTTEQCRKILTSVAGFSKCVLILTGGEPMERSDIYELIRYGRDLGLRMVMATCGYTITDESIANLKEAGILALSISLDGSSAQTHDKFRQTDGAFDSAIEAAKSARRTGIRFQINTTITKSNLPEISAIAKLAEELGAYCFNPFILVPTGRGEKIASEVLEPAEYEKLLQDLLRLKEKSPIEVRVTCGPQFARICRQTELVSTKSSQTIVNSVSGCMGGRGFGFISYRGDVQTCGFLDISAGNLVENSFDFGKIWVESQLLKEIRNLSAYRGNCGICEYLDVCGGCRARAYAMAGDYLDTDPVCNYQPRRKS